MGFVEDDAEVHVPLASAVDGQLSEENQTNSHDDDARAQTRRQQRAWRSQHQRSATPLSGVFHRMWRRLPASWYGERDPNVAFRSVLTLAGFVGLCIFIFLVPSLLSKISPDAPTPPGTSPLLDSGATLLEGDYGAVAADCGICSKLGVKVLHDMGGNAIDAMVSTVLCQGVLAPYASGLGGGAFMLIHFAGNETVRRKSVFIDARETAPSGIDPIVFENNETASRLGGMAVAIPGELRGLELAHRKYGSLPWADLVNPVVAIAQEATVSAMLARRISQMNATILSSPSLSALFTKVSTHSDNDNEHNGEQKQENDKKQNAAASLEVPGSARDESSDPKGGKEDLGSAITQPPATSNASSLPSDPNLSDGTFHNDTQTSNVDSSNALLREGDKLVNSALVNTLRKIADEGADALYKDWASEIGKEIRDAGGVMADRDIRNYRPVVRQPIESYYHGLKVLGAPPPSGGGASIGMALNILEGLEFRKHGRNSNTYLPLVETLKYVFAARSKLADPEFVNSVRKSLRDMLSKQVAMTVRSKIVSSGSKTHEPQHYSEDGIVRAAQRESGTAHVSIVDKFDNAVAITSTINTAFGAGFVSNSTGIIFNNEMDDFATSSSRANAFGLTPAPENAVKPGKRPLSSMSPTIVMHNDIPYLIVGGSGGPRIITSTLQVIVNVIDWGDRLGDAISAPRVHHQLIPNVAWMESVQPETCELYRALERPSGSTPGGSWSYWPSVCRAMKQAGHNVSGPSLDGVVQAALVIVGDRRSDGTKGLRRVFAASDPRKIGLAAAY